MLHINDQIPDLEVEAYHDDKIKRLKLSSFRGKWLVLLFYPGDFTFICPTELEEAATLYGEFRKLKAEVLSVSTDSVHVHKAWRDTSPAIKNIAFPMIADQTGRLSRAFGVYIDEGTDEGRALRGTFIVNPQG
ncbi:MAG: peroxiredoxin, partial [bacterium]|nr:peroxiredoxin [bacterium]MDZ4296593.1 peroxiredoxin [Patescibacteria group bacterium]